LETELNLDPDSNPNPELIPYPDPNLQIISDPAGSGCTTLHMMKVVDITNNQPLQDSLGRRSTHQKTLEGPKAGNRKAQFSSRDSLTSPENIRKVQKPLPLLVEKRF
jgi:hypothetical protein